MGKSSIEQPIHFFEQYFSEQGFGLLKESFYTEYREHENACTVDRENNSVTYYNNGINEKTREQLDEWKTIFFDDYLKFRLNKEKNLSKSLIRKSIAKVTNPKDFLQIQKNELVKLQSESVGLYNHYTFCDNIISELIRYIERKINLGNTNELIENKEVFTTKNKSPIFFIGVNEYLHDMRKILEEDNQLINNTDDFIEIFTGKPFEKKINWIKYKNALHYFIDTLCDCKRITYNKNMKWKIANLCFTYSYITIDDAKIESNNSIPGKKTRKIIADAISKINF